MIDNNQIVSSFDEFTELVKKRHEQINNINWQEKKELSINEIEALYMKIDSWLKPLLDDGIIQTYQTPIEAKDRLIGTYYMNKKTIIINGSVIEIIPQLTFGLNNIVKINIKGVYSQKESLVLLLRKEKKSKWELGSTGEILNKDSFALILSMLSGLIFFKHSNVESIC